MNVLVVNAGSSSLKYQLLDTDTREVFAKGNCERIGSDMGIFGHSENGGAKQTEEVPFPDHRSAIARVLEELAAAGDPEAQLAFDMFVYKIAAKAAEMATSMCGMDTLVFTAGIGEHAPAVRAGVADRLAFMGVKMDHARNALRGDGAWCLSAKDSKVKIFVIPTDEEFMIASDVERIVNGK